MIHFKWMDSEKYNDYPKPLRKNKYIFIFLMLFLTVINFGVFFIGINIQSILMAFKKIDDVIDGRKYYVWTLDNFNKIFQEIFVNPEAGTSLLLAFKNSMLIYFVGTIIGIPMGCIVSYLLWKKIVCYKFFRTIFYLPSILSSVVVVIIFRNIIAPNGLISTILIKLTGKPLDPLLAMDDTAIWMVISYNIWTGFAGSYIILTAALMRIPEEIVESVRLDGCSPLREYLSICIPLSWPTIYMIILGKVTGILNGDGPILLLTGGEYNTVTLGFWSYKQVFLSGQYEYPAAVGIIMTLIVAPLGIMAKNLMGKVYSDVEY